MSSLTHLEAIRMVLHQANRPMTSREIAVFLAEMTDVEIRGATPWKTVNARISEDIKNCGQSSEFMRTSQGQFGLRKWGDLPEFHSPPRKLRPIDETIRVVPSEVLSAHETKKNRFGFYDVDLRRVLSDSVEMVRLEAEETTEVVQLIPTFLIRSNGDLLCYTRTKRLPEARLHGARSLSFGGHLQSEDIPELFFFDDRVLNEFLYRELYEELELTPQPKEITFLGMLHLAGNDFEKQHAGLIYDVVLPEGTSFSSLEPGMHTDLSFDAVSGLLESKDDYDSWSRAFLDALVVRMG